MRWLHCLQSRLTSASAFSRVGYACLPILVTLLSLLVGSMSTTRHFLSDARTIHQLARAGSGRASTRFPTEIIPHMRGMVQPPTSLQLTRLLRISSENRNLSAQPNCNRLEPYSLSETFGSLFGTAHHAGIHLPVWSSRPYGCDRPVKRIEIGFRLPPQAT